MLKSRTCGYVTLQCGGRERPPWRGDARRVSDVAGAGRPSVAVALADTSPLLDAAPAQRRSGGPLRILLRERRAARPGAGLERRLRAHFRGRERPVPFCVRARGAEHGPLPVPVRVQRVAEPVRTGRGRRAPPLREPAPKAGRRFSRAAWALGPVLTGSRRGPSPGGCGISRPSRPRLPSGRGPCGPPGG